MSPARILLPAALRWLLLLGAALAACAPARAQFGLDDDLLPAAKAFALDAETRDGRLLLRWNVADGYYMYRDRIQVRSTTEGVSVGGLDLPEGKQKEDEFFGRMEVYRGRVEVPVRLEGASAGQQVRLMVRSQGCADRGVCYPPHEEDLTVRAPAPRPTAAESAAPAAPTPGTPAASPAPSTKTDSGGPLQRLRSLGDSLGLGGGEDELLPPEQAFRPMARGEGDTIIVTWDIAEGYYLYRDKLQLDLVEPPAGVTLGALQLPPGEVKEDELFGRVQVFHHQVEGRAQVQGLARPRTLTLEARYQGCAERGVCYPPQKKRLQVELDPTAAAGPAARPQSPTPPAETATPAAAPAQAPEQDRLAGLILEADPWKMAAVFFGAGLLLAFTPCVFPMIPILSSIIAGQGATVSTGRAFVLSLVYVLAMAVTYTAAGVIAGLFGANLQAAFQDPWILSAFAAVFVALALSMFGFYELQLPGRWQTRLSEVSNRQRGGSLVGVAVMGLLSALIVGPCVAPPLMAALIVIGQSGDPVLGGSALFAMSLGMGLPLLAVGTGLGSVLPRAGAWMDAVKAVFGVLLLGLAIWLLGRILPDAVTLALWAALAIASAVYLGALEPLEPEAGGWTRLWKGLGILLLIYGALLLIGAAAGSRGDLLQPLRGVSLVGGPSATGVASHGVEFRPIKGVEGLERELAAARAAGQPVMLDFYADWCVECKKMERYTFSDPAVMQVLQGVRTLQADVTPNDARDRALYERFGIIGPPAILFFDAAGRELEGRRLIGFMGPDAFAPWVRGAFD